MDIFSDAIYVKKLNEKLKQGGVISFVTDTVWGVGCLPDSEKGVENIYELKNRDRSKPLILMSDKVENLLPYVKDIPPHAHELMEKHFPGALTLIFEKSDKTPDYVTSFKNTVGSYEEAVANVGEHVEYVFEDYGFNAQGLASTVALAVNDEIKVLRQGEVVIE